MAQGNNKNVPLTPADFSENVSVVRKYIRKEIQDWTTTISDEHFAQCGLKLYESGALNWIKRADKKPTAVEQYFLNWLPYYLMATDQKNKATQVLTDFSYLMKRLRYGSVERVILDYTLFENELGVLSPDCDAFIDVIRLNAPFLLQRCKDNPAYRKMLQIATELAADCSVTQAAERWINPQDGDSPYDWYWGNKAQRPKRYCPHLCKQIIRDAGENAILLSNGDALSWSWKFEDNNLRIFDLETGKCKAILKGHRRLIWKAFELKSGNIISISADDDLRIWLPDGECRSILGLPNADDDFRIWSSDGECKAVLKGHTDMIRDVLELKSGDLLSWSDDKTLRIWSPDGVCKAVLEGHTGTIFNAFELESGDILSQSEDKTLRIWSPDGVCKTVQQGPDKALKLSSGNILLWNNSLSYIVDLILSSPDNALRIWSLDGSTEAVLEGHTSAISGALELKSDDILTWSYDSTLRIWSPDGVCKAVMEGHTGPIDKAMELRSGDILSWSINDKDLLIWSPDGVCKAVLEGHSGEIVGAIELISGDILTWSKDSVKSRDNSLRIWSLDGVCKMVLEGHTDNVNGAVELESGDILSWSDDKMLRIWSPDACQTPR